MKSISLILLAAGSSTRFSKPIKKQWLRIGSQALWEFVATRFTKFYNFKEVIIVASSEDFAFISNLTDHKVVAGGNTREESLRNALPLISSDLVLVSDVARAFVPKSLIARVIEASDLAECIVPALPVVDTVVREGEIVDREKLQAIQTPQLSHTKSLKDALANLSGYTDESTLIRANGGTVHYVKGSEKARKITHPNDTGWIKKKYRASTDQLVGFGFDTHSFEEGKKMVLGGVELDLEYGFKAHSDGDVAIHALIDAILGACGMGDIGTLFPDTDQVYKNADSKVLLDQTLKLVESFGFEVRQADMTIIAQKPRLEAYKPLIRSRIAELLNLHKERVNIKASTMEKMGFVGRGEGVIVQVVVTVGYIDWRQK